MSSGSQPATPRNRPKRLDARRDALPHQLFAIGLHDRFQPAALAELVLARVAVDDRRREPIAGPAQLFVAQHDRHARRADRERRDRILDRFARERLVGVEQRDRVFDQLAAALGADDDPGPNLTQLDHVGDLDHAVEQAEAGVRDVVDHRLAGQVQAVMHAAGGGRLQKVAADRAVNERAEIPRIDAAGLDRPAGRFDADRARPRAGRKEPPLADARHQLQPALGQPQPLVERREPLLELGRRDDFVRQRVAERFQANAAKMHRQISKLPKGERGSPRGDAPKRQEPAIQTRITEHSRPSAHP